MSRALLYTELGGGRVRCELCAHYCRLAPGQSGICGVRHNHKGVLETRVGDLVIATHVDPIEKKPFFHVLPGTASYSLAAPGCNFHCRHCQNYQISQLSRPLERLPGQHIAPEALVREARATGCRSISFTYTEPTIYFELLLAVAARAREQGLLNLIVSNGFMTAAARRKLAGLVNGANIDLKAWSDSFYRRICGARSKLPVLETIAGLLADGVWVEVTTLLIPGHNDAPGELEEMAAFLVSLSPEIPWHVSGFFPTYRLTRVPPTPPETLLRARQIGLEAGLKYVFTGNRPGEGGEDTVCPGCGTLLLRRYGFRVLENHLQQGCCPVCGRSPAGIFV